MMTFFPEIFALLWPALIPPAHIAVLYYFWKDYTRVVNRDSCKNDCWDTVYKGNIYVLFFFYILKFKFILLGPYETGIAAYKHFFFNATSNSIKIWFLIVVGIIALYECIKHLTKLLIHKQARLSMVILFLASIFSHYYAWWMVNIKTAYSKQCNFIDF